MIIYKITNNINGRIYIGRTIESLQRRWQRHIWRAFNESHPNIPISSAIVKYGKGAFTPEIIYSCDSLEKLLEAEKSHIVSYLKSGATLYNVTKGGDGSSGMKHSLGTKLKISHKRLCMSLKGTVWHRCRPCVINGIWYPSQTEAARRLNVNRSIVQRWVSTGKNGRERVKRNDSMGFKEGYNTLIAT